MDLMEVFWRWYRVVVGILTILFGWTLLEINNVYCMNLKLYAISFKFLKFPPLPKITSKKPPLTKPAWCQDKFKTSSPPVPKWPLPVTVVEILDEALETDVDVADVCLSVLLHPDLNRRRGAEQQNQAPNQLHRLFCSFEILFRSCWGLVPISLSSCSDVSDHYRYSERVSAG